jgi:hypothetical protein
MTDAVTRLIEAPAIGSQWRSKYGVFTVETEPVWSDAIKLWFVWGI